jgi:hypothetical protein
MQKKLSLGILLWVILLSNSGCVAFLIGGGAGAGTVAYLKGELKSVVESSLEKTLQATQTALEDLEFPVTSKQKDAFSAELVARRGNDKKIEIDLKKISEKMTEIRIRVGVFGDESLSQLILERINKHIDF